MSLLSSAGVEFLLRWLHFLAGITWIGLLYYFNFVQGPFFAEADAATKSAATQKLVPRALWWFRWGAMLTFLSGAAIIGMRMGPGVAATPWGVAIMTGALFGTLMFLNVWLVIWPNQKVVIASAVAAATGGQANPVAAAAGRRAFLASRSNVVFSIPMLFFMGSARHMTPGFLDGTNDVLYWLLALAVILAVQLNAMVGVAPGRQKYLSTVSGTIHMGLGLTLVLYLLGVVVNS